MTSSDGVFQHRQVAVDGFSLHVVEAGDPQGAPFLFLHGWPESWRAWRSVMGLASKQVRALAIDLPGIGESAGAATDGSKRQLADAVRRLVVRLGLTDLTLVGHDVGGMIVYAYLRAPYDLARAVIMDVVAPGIDPWEEVLRNPHIWHFAMHSIPTLPERLVQGRQADYFDFFYNTIAADPAKITPEARGAHVEAYSTDGALTAGFDWYRAFPRDAAENKQASDPPSVATPLLYLRGEREGGDINTYTAGFRAAGLTHVDQDVVPGAGHFLPEEAPEATWQRIAAFARL